MCTTCGCGEPDLKSTVLLPGEELVLPEENPNPSYDSMQRVIDLHQDIMHHNYHGAEKNREFFRNRNILCLNLVSSPGSGKTSLLEALLRESYDFPSYVIEGDQQTFNDAARIDALKIPVAQINTGKGCHLDAEMVKNALDKLNPVHDSLLYIENVGNLVCPAMFDLGEEYRIVIASVTEGEDKPIKYPDMFESAQLCVLNKVDLLPYLNFNVEKFREYALMVNPNIEFLATAATQDEGVGNLKEWILNKKELVCA